MTRVLVMSPEPVAERMAGPAIRALELARALDAHVEVTLAAPAPSDPALAGVAMVEAGVEDFERLLVAARGHDVVVAQELPPTLVGRLAKLPARLVCDLYNPILMELLEAVVAKSPAGQRRVQRLIGARTLAQLAAADLVLCASDRQRDLWLGGLSVAGLIPIDAYRADPTLRSLIEVVPFGIPPEPPTADRDALRERVPAIGAEDRVMLWAGGIWSWLDALTPIRAAGLLAERAAAGKPRTHLVFLGTGRPGLAETGQAQFAESAREQAARLGLEGECVHFVPGWVPYEQRGALLAAADIGVSAHPDHLEARFAFRARVLDYLWAGLPVACTSGDALAELVEHRGLGRTVAPGDAEGFAAACAELLDDGAGERERIAEVRPSLTWEQAVAPLAAWCADPPPRRGRSVSVLRRALRSQYLHSLVDTVSERGLREGARRVARRLRRGI
jgi:glycosyltransferase involved in cell wall biosynthesis